ncbi:MAG: hypothetical protein HOQ05_06010 [Corynebacteriales bacterium]|nr:hypothetical protein [Mycobacteriales bacterium]
MSTHRYSDPEREGLPSTADDDSTAQLGQPDSRTGEGPDPAALPSDHPVAAEDYGMTPWEQEHKEPLEQRLRREEPDSVRHKFDESDQLVAPDEGAGPDLEKDLIASDAGPSSGPTAEEDAVHRQDETPGN